MTAPQPHGYPDWGRYVAGGDKIYLDLTNNAGTATDIYGPYFVGDVTYVNLSVNSFSSLRRIDLQFFDDQLLSNQLDIHHVSLRSGGLIDSALPVLGPWMRVLVLNVTSPSAYAIAVTSAQSKRGGLSGNAYANVLMSQINVAVGAGATSTLEIGRVMPGPAVLNVQSALATWTAALESIEAFGTVQRMDTISQASPNSPRETILPYCTVRFSFTNPTAAAGNFTASLVGTPLWP